MRKTMKWLDANGDAAVSFEEFKGPMIEATEGLGGDQFDAAVLTSCLAAEGEAVEPDPADDLPPKFGAYVTQFPSHAKCKWIGVKRVDSCDDEKKICVVDCRSPDERAVSIIKDSVPLGDVKFVSFEDNNVEAVAGGADVSAACEGADVVVCVSAVGAEGGIAAPVLAEKLEGKVEVRNLVGGSWRGTTRAARWWTAKVNRWRLCTRGNGGASGLSPGPGRTLSSSPRRRSKLYLRNKSCNSLRALHSRAHPLATPAGTCPSARRRLRW